MKEFLKDLVVAIIVVLIITAFIKPTIVKQSSMEPTLYENHYLFLNKMAYKLKEHPQYGDIVVFKSELDRDDGRGKKLLIKRVIGVEGDVIDVADGVVYRNGIALEEPYTLEGYTDGTVTNYTVPADQVYVMGDNRSKSLDSRELGAIDESSIMGKAFVRLYPFSEFGLL